MFLHARSSTRRPLLHPAAASLSPIFRERCLSVLAKGQLARANNLSIKAADHKETLDRLKELSTTTIGTASILNRIGTARAGVISTSSGKLSPSSNDIRPIEADLGAFGETSTLPADVDSLPFTPASDTSAAKYLTYPPTSRTYPTLNGLKEGNGGKELVALSNSFHGPAQLALDTIEPAFNIVELAIPVSIPTETAVKPSIHSSFKDVLPLDNDTEFTPSGYDVDSLSMHAVLVQGSDVESDDVNGFVLISREVADDFSEQPNADDGGDDWLEVDA